MNDGAAPDHAQSFADAVHAIDAAAEAGLQDQERARVILEAIGPLSTTSTL
jgi:hypothetical protein